MVDRIWKDLSVEFGDPYRLRFVNRVVNTSTMSFTTVSCSDSRNCTAGGFAVASTSGHALAIVDSEVDGHWQGVTTLLGSRDSSTDSSSVVGIACFSNGSCQALVQVLEKYTVRTASFVMAGGRWTLASYLTPSLWAQGQSWVTGLSCSQSGLPGCRQVLPEAS